MCLLMSRIALIRLISLNRFLLKRSRKLKLKLLILELRMVIILSLLTIMKIQANLK